MAQFYTYDADEVTIGLGPILAEGFQDGEMVSIEPGAEVFTDVVGTDGQVTRSKTLNKTATITVKLMQSSSTNDLFSALLTTDANAPNGAGVVPIFIRDRNGRSLHTGAHAWLSAWPAVTYDRGATVREWVIRVSRLTTFVGGN
jgi:hypothetical protein